jgi:hypothetical protein
MTHGPMAHWQLAMYAACCMLHAMAGAWRTRAKAKARREAFLLLGGPAFVFERTKHQDCPLPVSTDARRPRGNTPPQVPTRHSRTRSQVVDVRRSSFVGGSFDYANIMRILRELGNYACP